MPTRLGEIRDVGVPVPSRDGSTLLVPAAMAGDDDRATENAGRVLVTTAAVRKDHPDIRVVRVGDRSIGKGINDQVGNDLSRAKVISLPVMLVALGTIVAAGAGVAGDVRGRLARQHDRVDGQGDRRRLLAAATSGHSVVVSGVAVIVSMAGLYLANDGVAASLATGSVIVVVVAMLGSLTVLPALLARLGRRVDRPLATFLPSVLALGALPAPDMKLKSSARRTCHAPSRSWRPTTGSPPHSPPGARPTSSRCVLNRVRPATRTTPRTCRTGCRS